MSATRELIRLLVADSKDLSKWKPDSLINDRGFPYEVIHIQTGCKIWVSNSWYGLQITLLSGSKYPVGDAGSAVSFASSIFGWATWRRPLAALGPKFRVMRPDRFEVEAETILPNRYL